MATKLQLVNDQPTGGDDVLIGELMGVEFSPVKTTKTPLLSCLALFGGP